MFGLFAKMFGLKKHTCGRSFEGFKKGDRFHFIAIGGVGQSALAKILVKLGYEVSGSDINDSKYLSELKHLGAQVFIGHDENNVPDDCFVVVSSAIRDDNPELMKARELGLPILHRSDILMAVTWEFGTTIGFAGTHGKTTTSGLCSYVLSKMKTEPAFAVGGIIPELNTNANASRASSFFVAELDESDGTIVKYKPEIFVINNLEADHLDFYTNGLSDVLETFKKTILSLNNGNKIIVNIDDNGVLELLEDAEIFDSPNREIIKFSVRNSEIKDCVAVSDVYADNIEFNSAGAQFNVIYKGEKLGKIQISLKGEHNVYNALAVICALIEAGFEFKDFAPHFKGFTGVGRRFQQVFKNENVEIIDDYAHHPSEIKATLAAAKEYAEKSGKQRVIAIFQPHRYTRLKALFNEFLESFNHADLLVVLDVFSAGDLKDAEFNSETFTKTFTEKHPSMAQNVVYIGGKVDEVPDKVREYVKDGDIILTLGAGDVTKLGKIIGEKL